MDALELIAAHDFTLKELESYHCPEPATPLSLVLIHFLAGVVFGVTLIVMKLLSSENFGDI